MTDKPVEGRHLRFRPCGIATDLPYLTHYLRISRQSRLTSRETIECCLPISSFLLREAYLGFCRLRLHMSRVGVDPRNMIPDVTRGG